LVCVRVNDSILFALQLPPLEQFLSILPHAVRELRLFCIPVAMPFPDFTRLQTLGLHLTDMNLGRMDALGLRVMQACPKETALEITAETDSNVHRCLLLERYQSNVTKVSLRPGFRSVFFSSFRRLDRLECVAIEGCLAIHVTPHNWDALSWQRLPRLALAHCDISSLYFLGSNNQLNSLSLDACPKLAINAALAEWLPSLRELSLVIRRDDNRRFAADLLLLLPLLRVLHLDNLQLRFQDSYITDALIRVLPQLESLSLELIDLPRERVTAPFLRKLRATLYGREELDLPSLESTDIALSYRFVGSSERVRDLLQRATHVKLQLFRPEQVSADVLPRGLRSLRLVNRVSGSLQELAHLVGLETLELDSSYSQEEFLSIRRFLSNTVVKRI
jgi:hypothetical protein